MIKGIASSLCKIVNIKLFVIGPQTVRKLKIQSGYRLCVEQLGQKISTADYPPPLRGLSASWVLTQVGLDRRGTMPTYPHVKATGNSLSHPWKKKAIGGGGPRDWRLPQTLHEVPWTLREILHHVLLVFQSFTLYFGWISSLNGIRVES